MVQISNFKISKLHGFIDFELKLKDNTLILVGENGTGKTTVLNLFFYFLSGQWSLLTKYNFDSLAITIDMKRYTLQSKELKKTFSNLDPRLLRRLPPPARERLINNFHKSGPFPISDLEALADRYEIPLHMLIPDMEFLDPSSKNFEGLKQTLTKIQESLQAQILYLPTYRRIEQELNLIFKGIDDRELMSRRQFLSSRRTGDSFVELVEFGMKDVESAINEKRSELEKFARERLNNLTFTYLGDIVDEQYKSVDLNQIKKAEEKTINNILNRIPDSILNPDNKQHLREIISRVKTNESQSVHAQVICHYFIKLMAFHQELEEMESKIVDFCKSCNDYLVDKEFEYDKSNFTFAIRSKDQKKGNQEIKLQFLSSGEKQIVSLFSHLYLSGGKNYFVLIDEPELSLSVEWQRKFLSDIRRSSFCAGLVAVTHSPFIYENDLRKYAHGLGEFVV